MRGNHRTGLAIGAALIVLLAGCSRRGEDRVGLHGATLPVQGIDVSRHQGEIDWPAVARSGIDFAWIKATEGGDHLDPMFRRNWELAAAAGVRRGAYHFIYWCRRAEDQAAWFVANVPADPGAMPPVLDAEWNPQSRTCPQKIPKEQALATMKTILVAMERAFGKRPLIYVPLDFFRDVMSGGELDDYPIWARSLNGDPTAAYGGRRWQVWQYSESGSVEGIDGEVDRNGLDGRREDWPRWSADPGTQPVQAAAVPQNSSSRPSSTAWRAGTPK